MASKRAVSYQPYQPGWGLMSRADLRAESLLLKADSRQLVPLLEDVLDELILCFLEVSEQVFAFRVQCFEAGQIGQLRPDLRMTGDPVRNLRAHYIEALIQALPLPSVLAEGRV